MTTSADPWTPIARQQAGSPIGGQFAAKANTAPAGQLRLSDWDVPDELNVVLGDFLDEHAGDPTPADCRAFLAAPPERAPNGHGEDHEWRCAMRAISARIADGQGGVLREVQDLRPGDRVDLARLWTTEQHTDTQADFASAHYATVVDEPGMDGDGTVMFKVAGAEQTFPAQFPEGTVVPVQGIVLDGKELTEREALHVLTVRGQLPAPRSGETQHALLERWRQQHLEGPAGTPTDR